jgi:2-keto-4-pentenoate hydratase
VTPEEARAAVSAIAPAFEINEIRNVGKRTPLPVRVASGLNNWGIVVGAEVAPPDWDATTAEVAVRRNGDAPETFSMPAGSFDDPFVSLSRLCHRLARFGRALAAGDRVITGAFSHHSVGAGETWSADFSRIGVVEVSFTS